MVRENILIRHPDESRGRALGVCNVKLDSGLRRNDDRGVRERTFLIRHPDESRGRALGVCNVKLDSGFRRNDDEGRIREFLRRLFAGMTIGEAGKGTVSSVDGGERGEKMQDEARDFTPGHCLSAGFSPAMPRPGAASARMAI